MVGRYSSMLVHRFRRCHARLPSNVYTYLTHGFELLG